MKRKRRSFCALVLTALLLAGCASQQTPAAAGTSETSAATTEESSEAPADTSAAEGSTNAIARVAKGMDGREVVVPMAVNTVISLAPSTTEILIDFGIADKIVAVDTYSAMDYADILPAGIPAFDMMNPDNEQIVALGADLVFTTGMSYAWGEDVFASARDAGVTIIDIESATSLQEIMDSILFIGDCVMEKDAAEAMVEDMAVFLDEVEKIMEATDLNVKKSVLFELSTPSAEFPTIYSVGPGSYIDEIISLVGGENVASDTDTAWPALTEEAAVAYNPDVILTTDNYTPDVENVLLTLSGWENVSAVQNGEVYLIDANRVNRPNHRVCGAILEIGTLLYPELFEELANPFEEEALKDAA